MAPQIDDIMQFIDDSLKPEHIPLENIDMMYIIPVTSKFNPEICVFKLTKEKPSTVYATPCLENAAAADIPYQFVDWDRVFDKNLVWLDLELKQALLQNYNRPNFSWQVAVELELVLVKKQPGYIEFDVIHTREILTDNHDPAAMVLTQRKTYYGKIVITQGLIRFLHLLSPLISNGSTRITTFDQLIRVKMDALMNSGYGENDTE